MSLSISPYITFRGNCREAIEFYKNTLNAQVEFLQTFGESPMSDMGPADHIMHCTLKVEDSLVMLSDDPSRAEDDSDTNGNISLAITLHNPEQANEIFNHLAKNGSILMPLEKTYWAQAFGMVVDQFGVKWMVNCE